MSDEKVVFSISAPSQVENPRGNPDASLFSSQLNGGAHDSEPGDEHAYADREESADSALLPPAHSDVELMNCRDRNSSVDHGHTRSIGSEGYHKVRKETGGSRGEESP